MAARDGRGRATALRQVATSGTGALVALAGGNQKLFMERAVRTAENAGVVTGRRQAVKGTAALAALAVVGAIAFTAPFTPTDAGDYANPTCAAHRCDDAAPAIVALQDGQIATFFREQPAMGSFSLIIRAPAVAIARAAGGNTSAQYRAGALICMLAAVLLAFGAAFQARRRGVAPLAAFALGALVIFNPANGDALQRGHPEEILAAALLAGAALSAARRPLLAGALVGLAMATKQWALLGLLPVAFIALEGTRLRLILSAVGVAALLVLPMAIGNPGAFRAATSAAANPPGSAKPLNVWFPLAHSETITTRLPDGSLATGKAWILPHTLDRATHWLIIALCAGLIALWWWRRGPGPAVLLLALVLLIRVGLDPRAHPYHLTPFVMALAAVEAMVVARVPWRIATAAAVLAVVLRLFDDGRWHLAMAVFVAAAVPAAITLAVATFGSRGATAHSYNRLAAGD